MASRKPLDLELDLNDKIFDDDRERQELQQQMAQLSPRRAIDSSKFAVMTLPFMEDISPSAALKRLYEWFVRDSSSRDKADEQTDADGTSTEDDPDGGSKISRDEFNRLQRCIGKPVITDREWRRALEALGMADDQEQVKRKDFKALFGPPPFFGSENVQGIVKYVMAAEEHIHFAQVLLDRFGVDVVDRRFNGKGIGLSELQAIQRSCCLDRIFWRRRVERTCEEALPARDDAVLGLDALFRGVHSDRQRQESIW
ncbi:hypothetical protein PINS_up001737 [Pythium insidiosum]|nr:hypothetical protein PINS_up001737 [Pythium insidiosum]